MPIATKSGGLILKDGRLATNCACCGDGICSCVQRMPSAVVLTFQNFTYSWFGSSTGGPDMSVYAAELATFQESYQLTIPRTAFSAGSHADYSLQSQCYNSVTCTKQASCTSTEQDYLRLADVFLRINCDETLSELEWNLVSSRACWNQFANNREDYYLRALGGVEMSSVSNLASSFPISAAYEFCDGQSWDLDVDAPNNSPVIGQTNFYAQWVGGVFEEYWGNYVATSGTLSISPIFDNPLP